MDQSSYSKVRSAGYEPFLRADFLKILNAYDGKNDILLDYRRHLQQIEDEVQSYTTQGLKDWHPLQWMGFYMRLQELLKAPNAGWDYVPNRSGGFWGFWWGWVPIEKPTEKQGKCELHIQLEEDKLRFKIYVSDADAAKMRELRWKWHRKIMEAGGKDFGLQKPARFGNGTYMTVCEFRADYRVSENNIINMDKTLARLRDAEGILASATQADN